MDVTSVLIHHGKLQRKSLKKSLPSITASLPRSRPGIHNRGDPQKKAHQMPELQEDIKRQGVQGQKVWTEVLALLEGFPSARSDRVVRE